MTLTYCSSMDIYGTGATSLSGRTYNFTTDDWTIAGDLISNSPAFGPEAGPWNFYGGWYIDTCPWGQRRGDYAFRGTAQMTRGPTSGFTMTNSGNEIPLFPIPGAGQDVRIIHFAFSISSLPGDPGRQGRIMSFHNGSGTLRGQLMVNPTGRLEIYNGGRTDVLTSSINLPTLLATTSAPVIVPETWVSLNVKITSNGVDGNVDLQVYVGEIIAANLVLDLTAVAFSSDGTIDGLGLLGPSFAAFGMTSDSSTKYMRDLVVCDTSGTENNDLLGQVFVGAQEVRGEDLGGGWSAEARTNISDGVLNMQDANTGLRVGDNANLELGTGDFAIEGFWRFHSLPIGTEEMVLASKWAGDTNQRSWKLYYDADPGEIKFDISTDGSAVTTVWSYPFTPDLDKYYHFAVDRETDVIRVFVNGTQFGVDIADTNTYFDGTASFGLGAEYTGANALVTATAFDGFVDEFRLTVGSSRYNADFTPTTVPFGRDGIDDTDFANVELLMGFDNGALVDESSNAFTLVPGAGVAVNTPLDGDNSFQVLNRRPSWDDTYIEARNTFATTILTLTGLPLDTETVTLGSQTYTWVTALSAGPTVAYEVLIGADEAECISNILEAVNGGTGLGTVYSAGTVANLDVFASTLPSPQVSFTATAIGVAGNSVASTETLTNGSFPDTTFAGGEDIPAYSQFAMERLPVDVTSILGLQITARGYKSDAGDANLRFDLVGPSAGVGTGAALSTDLSPSWLRQIFEIDPDTAATITPSTITGGRIRVTRTV